MKAARVTAGVGLVLTAAIVAGTVPASASRTVVHGPFRHDPLASSATVGSLPLCEPFSIPEGFRQAVLHEETGECGAPVLDIYDTAANGGVFDTYGTSADWPDMNTVNERGREAGRYLYRTHEVRSSTGLDYGSLSVVDLRTGDARVLEAQPHYEALDGIEWTPWGTILFAEEVGPAQDADPNAPDAVNGLLYELSLDRRDPMQATGVQVRPAVGSLAHEGIAVAGRHVYVVDEFASGGIFRFTPDRYGDLSSGSLSVLRIVDDAAAPGAKTGTAEWIELDDRAVAVDARAAAAAAGATGYGRPEDIEVIGDKVYVAVTSEDRVLEIEPRRGTAFVREYVAGGVNIPNEADNESFGIDNPDNLVADRAGNLYVIEDNSPGDILVATPDHDRDGYADTVGIFATLTTAGAEPTGAYFGTDPKTMFVNVQHSANKNDMTIAISKR